VSTRPVPRVRWYGCTARTAWRQRVGSRRGRVASCYGRNPSFVQPTCESPGWADRRTVGVGCTQLIHPARMESMTHSIARVRRSPLSKRRDGPPNNPGFPLQNPHPISPGFRPSPGVPTKSPPSQPASSLIECDGEVRDRSALEVPASYRCFPGSSHQTQSADTFASAPCECDRAPRRVRHSGLIATSASFVARRR